MSAQYTPGRIDSTPFRRGVRAFKTGASNPYNGPELREEWEAGRAYAAAKARSACPDCEPGATCGACFDAAIAKATRSPATIGG